MVAREAALRLDGQWARIRAGAAELPPAEAEALLAELIGALREPARTDPECAARLGLRLSDLAARRFAEGDRPAALAAIEEGMRYAEQAAPHSPEYARWYARGLINHGVWLAWPLSDADRLPRFPLGPGGETVPGPIERAAGERARDLTLAAVEVWRRLDQRDPVNIRGLAQAEVFAGDRLAELGLAADAVAWAADAEAGFRALARAGGPGYEEAEEAVKHLGRQLELRLRLLSFDTLAALRADGRLPETLLPHAVLAARIQGVDPLVIAAGLQVDEGAVRATLSARPWRAVWRFEVRGPDGLWDVLGHPWRGSADVTDRTAEETGTGLVRDFTTSPDYPGDATPWRVLVWWHEEGDPAGSRFRLTHTPSGGHTGTPS
ncbi:hypothetical protein [Streptomyces sp. NRRL S-87]|uniref:hypothetical protein n=1 Tax=Streptomyces sp. NRRL S-87 TaxID=1463920 RepID=UPI00131AE8AD|nr:hypothetical protein [Streptomyces sp. NRRL S-87]